MNIDFYAPFFNSTNNEDDAAWKNLLRNRLIDLFNNPTHGDFKNWLSAINNIPRLHTSHAVFDDSIIEIGTELDLSKQQKVTLDTCLHELIPWRKGPFKLFDILIDAEWCSDQKWDRVQSYLPNLKNKKVLDVGCGNGYYMLRMLGAGAAQVIGVEPNLLFLAQYYALTQYLHSPINAHLFPLKLEELPSEFNDFDYVFSMGVLYHRREPLSHLSNLLKHTTVGGTVIVETLVIDDTYGQELKPSDRYAGMRNVWRIPSAALVISWLKKSGFSNCMLLETHTTTVEEQRSTAWMPYHSLSDFLDPNDPMKTIEGYPAPVRAIFSGIRPIT